LLFCWVRKKAVFIGIKRGSDTYKRFSKLEEWLIENIYAKNLPNVSRFNIIITQSVLLNSSTFYKYDLDLRLYTTFVAPVPFILQRKFKFTCCLLSGALDLGLYNLNYVIFVNLKLLN
jgi:hypothetical protein